jgi:hypothetical protein
MRASRLQLSLSTAFISRAANLVKLSRFGMKEIDHFAYFVDALFPRDLHEEFLGKYLCQPY